MLSLFQRKYFLLGVNVLTNGLKISDIIKKYLYELIFSQSDEQRW